MWNLHLNAIRSRAVLATSVGQFEHDEWGLQLLVEYSLQEPVSFEGLPASVTPLLSEQSSEAGTSSCVGDNLLTATPIHAVWINIKELEYCAGMLMSYYLGDQVVFTATYERTWEHKTKLPEADGDSNEKSKKKFAQAPTAVSHACKYPPGRQPPTFATIRPNTAADSPVVTCSFLPHKFQPEAYWAEVADIVDQETRRQENELFLFMLSDIILPFPVEVNQAAQHEIDVQIQVRLSPMRFCRFDADNLVDYGLR